VSVVLYFYDVVWGEYCFTRGNVCVPGVWGPLFLGFSSSRLMCEVMVSYVVCLASGKASCFMYWSHDGCICCVLYVVGLGSFLCSWFVGRVRVAMSVDIASFSLFLMRC
jgi:hypothetical protein